MLNLKFLNSSNTFFLGISFFLIFVLTPGYDLTSISESGVYFLFFILGYLIYYIISGLKLFENELMGEKVSIFIQFLKKAFVHKIKILKKIENFCYQNSNFYFFFVNIFLSFFFLIFFNNFFCNSRFGFLSLSVFCFNFFNDKQLLFKKSFLHRNGRA